ncbi:low molecular weight phosphotyrosine protein phosphatase [Kingella negevensis]|uniref:protein-tyrosine-phosphatase n=1 Tax=Kingella negevensis TaxID=1522312 RepID=A0A238TEV0_9NEIS|nr:low molecular weight protein-tyrosine-phosphatase [Kingella negevensis]MDK4685532.1 low molecular weight phosphotyrosine protein phosphatase [Kingella negevensis]MDK4697001.1 low molecular weight phosphotyrosine protein phosphatase [Kingella negevensis]MDK4708183.1 low molecular weight phosphotyrosine protein phosphatase [Kingella negevensis]MDK4709748.1 low molecular weight phosphotyrosine protein phosphatase [Kingella negevensis]SNB78328.1 Low molecular weight protein-tyrosine-phosphatase
MKKILFICLGNICRSPMAEYIFRQKAQELGLNVQSDSAGTSGWHDGEAMHCGTADILDGMGIASNDFVSSKVPSDALQTYDYLIVMDSNNLRDVEKLFGKHPKQIFKITDLLPQPAAYDHVPDPWYTGNFKETKDILTQCCDILVERLATGEM